MDKEISSISHRHSEAFKMLIELLIQRFCPAQIHCFAKSKASYSLKTCFGEAINSFKEDYFLLLVTKESTRIEHEIQDFTNAHFKHGIVTVIVHGKNVVLDALNTGNRFFANIYQSGTLLYSSDVVMPINTNINNSAIDSILIDKNHLDGRLLLIEGFLLGARECLSNLQYNACLFMLHQIVEQCCLALIRIHLGYRSNLHNLQRLLQLCCCFSTEPMKFFLLRTKEDDRLFSVLIKSYSLTRYSDGFLADKADVLLLYNRIELFLEFTKEMCNRKIMDLTI